MSRPGRGGGRLASRLHGFETTIFAEMTRLAELHGAVNLSQGFPDFAGPEFLKDAAVRAIESDHNQYARSAGLPALTEAIATSYRERFGLGYEPSTEVCVFSGATEGIACAFLGLVEPGDEVVLFEPYYDSYRACTSLAGATPRFVTLRAPSFRWNEDELRAAFSDRTKLVVLNTPHNPTGRVFSREEISLLAELCVRHDVLCLADEVYDRLVYEGHHLPIASLPGMRERTVTLGSTGKTFSLTGWKIGYATGPEPLVAALRSAHQYLTFAVATPFQHAMVLALGAPDAYFSELRTAYMERRTLLVEALRSAGFGVSSPEGTYFVLADLTPLGWDDDVAFCRHLVEEVGIAAVPPSVFYEHSEEGRRLVRFAFCKRRDTLEEAARRLAAASLARG
ncbi:MAG: aminotransferase class I/II-fold pyridoxal phosphate-dependent enzyme [Candidatus Eisenbacteria bacterium]|uniref:Aminotransferase class I/II-fold pyridoxal phosphate-dependent enzyme n=1 Tax=Eiseniibacteriota bacterium TaxID=2212470 RepID=A0A956NA85_UNCEI|nr:aminotransferase class I/II-fold pyridoxal phosphate-dependent enzyme [Candidatus Eisenbacteria bacterium]